MQDLQVVINDYENQFTTTTRCDETIVIFKNDASEELRESVMQAHGDRMPNDWIFETYQNILSNLSGYTNITIDDVQDNRGEVVDGLVSVYTSYLTEWLHDSPSNVYYLTEALEQDGAADGFKMLAMAQYLAIDEIFSEVVKLLENAISE